MSYWDKPKLGRIFKINNTSLCHFGGASWQFKENSNYILYQKITSLPQLGTFVTFVIFILNLINVKQYCFHNKPDKCIYNVSPVK